MIKIRYNTEAIADIKQIHDYIVHELGSQIAADKTVEKLSKSAHQLALFPEMGAPLSPLVDFLTDYRYIVSGKYLIFYRVEDQIVRIIRILYGRRDYLKILFNT